MQSLVIRTASVGVLAGAVSVSFAAQGAPEAPPSPVSGPGAAGTAPAGGPPGGKQPDVGINPMFLMIGVMVLLFFFMNRSQRKDEKKRKELVNSMKPGHKVVTIGGLHGEIVAVGEGTADVRVGEGAGVVMTFNKSAIATNVTLTANAAAGAAPAK